MAIEKARHNDAYLELGDDERQKIEDSVRELQTVYYRDDYRLIREKIDVLNEVTHHLAENMMNTAVGSALRGTKI